MYPVWLVGAAYFCLGLIFGSFLNVCIYRLPRGLSVVRPRSACPECHQMISAQDNIPVLSWLLLGGRCRHCKAPITPRYAVVEFTCAMLFLLCFLRSALPVDAVKGCVLCFLLLGLAFTDAETHLLPDAMTLTGLVAGILLSVISLVPGPAAALPAHPSAPSPVGTSRRCSSTASPWRSSTARWVPSPAIPSTSSNAARSGQPPW